jgi:DNA topoisomerase-3
VLTLVIAEKPSLGRAIAAALPGPAVTQRDCIRCGNDTVVAWCAGHILEQADPDQYNPAYKAWQLEHLPIVPAEWKLVPKTPALLKTIESLLTKASRVVHAGDPDREGQLLVDEVLAFLGYRGPIDRLLVSDINPEAVRRQLAALQPNTNFHSLSQAALARQRADWLFGMNLTRLYTLLGRAGGYEGVLSVGRVQTPLLGVIVRRDQTIERFRPVPYYALTASLSTTEGITCSARWQPGEAVAGHLDEEKRLLDKAVAEAIRARVVGASGTVVEHTHEKKAQPPPLPYSLADLQIDAAKRLGLSAQAVLDIAQRLYEAHRLTTYPRSDCPYLPEDHHSQASDVVAALAVHAPSLESVAKNANLSLRSKAWNDKKITAHHAVIPTANANPVALEPNERSVYELVARRYLLQFYPPHEYFQTTVAVVASGERFTATGRQLVAPGWRAAATPEPADSHPKRDAGDEPEDRGPLPALRQGDSIVVRDVAIADKLTRPPKPFTDDTLLQAMVNIASFVTDSAVKKLLTEADGIGTPATRAAIIETLFERGYVVREGKTIVSTPTGRQLVHALPAVATTPDLTAVWEAALRAIAQRQQELPTFLARVETQLCELIDQGRALGRITVARRPPAGANARHSTSPAKPSRPTRRSRSSSAR